MLKTDNNWFKTKTFQNSNFPEKGKEAYSNLKRPEMPLIE
jgi:hypothetical protein